MATKQLVTVRCTNCRGKLFYRTDVPLSGECPECGETIRVDPASSKNPGLVMAGVTVAAIGLMVTLAVYFSEVL